MKSQFFKPPNIIIWYATLAAESRSTCLEINHLWSNTELCSWLINIDYVINQGQVSSIKVVDQGYSWWTMVDLSGPCLISVKFDLL